MAAKKKERTKNKSSAAFLQELETLFRENRRDIYKVACGLTRNREDAKDVLQTIFAKLISGRPSKAFRKNPRGYLHKAAINAAMNVVRSRDVRRLTDDPLDSLEIAAPATDWEREENIERLRSAMATMDPDIVQILNLRYKDGYTCRQIAKIRGKPIGTVVSEIFRARLELQKLIWNEEKNREIQQKEHQRNPKPLLADTSGT